jgi:hypothetical protein
VLGAVCPVPLGSYRYRKRQGSGASLMVDVDVFPLAITDELEAWKEQRERERRWFSLDEASAAVDEEDLGILIHSFGSSQFQSAVRRNPLTALVGETTKGWSSMFAWFQRLLPKTGTSSSCSKPMRASFWRRPRQRCASLQAGPASRSTSAK